MRVVVFLATLFLAAILASLTAVGSAVIPFEWCSNITDIHECYQAGCSYSNTTNECSIFCEQMSYETCLQHEMFGCQWNDNLPAPIYNLCQRNSTVYGPQKLYANAPNCSTYDNAECYNNFECIWTMHDQACHPNCANFNSTECAQNSDLGCYSVTDMQVECLTVGDNAPCYMYNTIAGCPPDRCLSMNDSMMGERCYDRAYPSCNLFTYQSTCDSAMGCYWWGDACRAGYYGDRCYDFAGEAECMEAGCSFTTSSYCVTYCQMFGWEVCDGYRGNGVQCAWNNVTNVCDRVDGTAQKGFTGPPECASLDITSCFLNDDCEWSDGEGKCSTNCMQYTNETACLSHSGEGCYWHDHLVEGALHCHLTGTPMTCENIEVSYCPFDRCAVSSDGQHCYDVTSPYCPFISDNMTCMSYDECAWDADAGGCVRTGSVEKTECTQHTTRDACYMNGCAWTTDGDCQVGCFNEVDCEATKKYGCGYPTMGGGNGCELNTYYVLFEYESITSHTNCSAYTDSLSCNTAGFSTTPACGWDDRLGICNVECEVVGSTDCSDYTANGCYHHHGTSTGCASVGFIPCEAIVNATYCPTDRCGLAQSGTTCYDLVYPSCALLGSDDNLCLSYDHCAWNNATSACVAAGSLDKAECYDLTDRDECYANNCLWTDMPTDQCHVYCEANPTEADCDYEKKYGCDWDPYLNKCLLNMGYRTLTYETWTPTSACSVHSDITSCELNGPSMDPQCGWDQHVGACNVICNDVAANCSDYASNGCYSHNGTSSQCENVRYIECATVVKESYCNNYKFCEWDSSLSQCQDASASTALGSSSGIPLVFVVGGVAGVVLVAGIVATVARKKRISPLLAAREDA